MEIFDEDDIQSVNQLLFENMHDNILIQRIDIYQNNCEEVYIPLDQVKNLNSSLKDACMRLAQVFGYYKAGELW